MEMVARPALHFSRFQKVEAERNILKKYREVADANRCMVKASQRLRQVVLRVEEEYSQEYSCEVGCLRATGERLTKRDAVFMGESRVGEHVTGLVI